MCWFCSLAPVKSIIGAIFLSFQCDGLIWCAKPNLKKPPELSTEFEEVAMKMEMKMNNGTKPNEWRTTTTKHYGTRAQNKIKTMLYTVHHWNTVCHFPSFHFRLLLLIRLLLTVDVKLSQLICSIATNILLNWNIVPQDKRHFFRFQCVNDEDFFFSVKAWKRLLLFFYHQLQLWWLLDSIHLHFYLMMIFMRT